MCKLVLVTLNLQIKIESCIQSKFTIRFSPCRKFNFFFSKTFPDLFYTSQNLIKLKCGIQLPNIQEIKKRKKGSQVINSNLSAKKYKVLKSGD